MSDESENNAKRFMSWDGEFHDTATSAARHSGFMLILKLADKKRGGIGSFGDLVHSMSKDPRLWIGVLQRIEEENRKAFEIDSKGGSNE